MTNDEIKKGLKTCAEVSCEGCPYAEYVNTYRYSCSHKLKLDARNLIKKQEKDIKQLKTECALLDDELRIARQAKIDVLNELWEKVKDKGVDYKIGMRALSEEIDELLKEI